MGDSPAGRGEGSPCEDFFALGALFASALVRRVPGLESADAAADLMRRRLECGSYVALTDQARFGTDVGGLLRGLLSDNAKERWGYEEVRASGWMADAASVPCIPPGRKRYDPLSSMVSSTSMP